MIRIFDVLLRKAVIELAATNSVAAAHGFATIEHNRSAYVLKVLQASVGTRTIVRETAAASNSVGQKQLVAILTMFEVLSPEKKAAFINAYKTCASVVGGGAMIVAHQNIWQPGHIPPHYEP